MLHSQPCTIQPCRLYMLLEAQKLECCLPCATALRGNKLLKDRIKTWISMSLALIL